MDIKHEKGQRTMLVQNIPATIAGGDNRIKELEIEISYIGEGDGHKALVLDHCIIPNIVEALETQSCHNDKNEKQYRMRAECMLDVARFMLQAEGQMSQCLANRITMFPDVIVDFKTLLSLKSIKNILKSVVDGHVMLQTVALKEEYTGNR